MRVVSLFVILAFASGVLWLSVKLVSPVSGRLSTSSSRVMVELPPSSSPLENAAAALLSNDTTEKEESLLPQQIGGFHSTTLTHVIFTLATQLEVDELVDTISTSWIQFPPCQQKWDDVFPSHCPHVFPVVPLKPYLVIVLYKGTPLVLDQLHEILRNSTSSSNCFQPHVIFRYFWSRTKVVKYSLSEVLLSGACGINDNDEGKNNHTITTTVGYGLLLRPHTRPNRVDWLSDIAKSVLFPVPLFWVILPFQSRFPLLDDYAIIYRFSQHPTQNQALIKSRRNLCEAPIVEPQVEHTFPFVFFEHIRPRGRETLKTQWVGQTVFSVQEILHAYMYSSFRHDYQVLREQLASRVMVSDLLAVLFASNTKTTVAPPPSPQQHQHQRLTHVVFALPSVDSQFDRLRHTLKVWWERYPPCFTSKDTDLFTLWETNTCALNSNHHHHKKPVLVFMVSRRTFWELEAESVLYDTELKLRIQREVISSLLPSTVQCFSKIEICIIRLRARVDTYLTGSRILFERFVDGECTPNGNLALYIEPDARPVKRGWLTSLSASAIFPNSPLWILGSMFQGSNVIPDTHWWSNSWYFHFNGNGIYQVNGTFRDFYFSRVRPYVYALVWSESAMDMDIMDYVFDHFDTRRFHAEWMTSPQKRIQSVVAYPSSSSHSAKKHRVHVVKDFFPQSRYTDFILNKYHSQWDLDTLPPNAQIVHGGVCGGIDCIA